ncbi:hypothetical protein LY78DRAFT_293240 [Colletotrichum sublineola]|nr:hypothetical protein LY78DRAFT_293240 [Colletotrichum sublineola]
MLLFPGHWSSSIGVQAVLSQLGGTLSLVNREGGMEKGARSCIDGRHAAGSGPSPTSAGRVGGRGSVFRCSASDVLWLICRVLKV